MKRDYKEIKAELFRRGIFLHDKKYINNREKLNISDIEGYKYFLSYDSINHAKTLKERRFQKHNPYIIENIQNWLNKNNKTFSIICNQEYKGNNSKLSFKCNICNKDEIPFMSSWRTVYGAETGCLICSGWQVGKYNNLKYKFPEIAKDWNSDKNKFRPEEVSWASSERVWWRCSSCGYEWNTRVDNRTSGGNDCSECSIITFSKGEKKIKKWLDQNNIKYIRQKKFEKCKDKNYLKFDFYLPNYNLCIEYQGKQHYIPLKFFGGEKEFSSIQRRDNIKSKYCKTNKVNLLTISYLNEKNISDILYDNLFAIGGYETVPYINGDLDSLFMLYDVCNIYENLFKKDSQKLFNDLVLYLGNNGELEQVIFKGIREKEFLKNIDNIIRNFMNNEELKVFKKSYKENLNIRTITKNYKYQQY